MNWRNFVIKRMDAKKYLRPNSLRQVLKDWGGRRGKTFWQRAYSENISRTQIIRECFALPLRATSARGARSRAGGLGVLGAAAASSPPVSPWFGIHWTFVNISLSDLLFKTLKSSRKEIQAIYCCTSMTVSLNVHDPWRQMGENLKVGIYVWLFTCISSMYVFMFIILKHKEQM